MQSSTKSRDSLVIIPTYNEKENVADIIAAVLSLDKDFSVLIVDDGSPDGTADIVKGLMTTYGSSLNILERSGKLGLGTAYIAGFKWGLEKGKYQHIIEMDADFSHNPKDLLRLRDACLTGADLAVGSRYVKGGDVVDWSWERILLSKGASRYVRLVLGMPIMDPTSGFKCYRSALLARINLPQITFVGYAFQIAMKYAAFSSGAKIIEVPISFKDREKGTSKMNFSIFKEAIFGVIRLRNSKLYT